MDLVDKSKTRFVQSQEATPVRAPFRVSRYLTPIYLILGLLGAIVIYTHRPPARIHHYRRMHEDREHYGSFSSGSAGPFRQMGMPRWAYSQPRKMSLYLANLSTRVGQFVVSVRQVRAGENSQNLFLNLFHRERFEPMRETDISLQVVASNPDRIARVRSMDLLSVRDDTGKILKTEYASPRVQFPNGMAALYFLTQPDPRARFLLRLDGELVVCDESGRNTKLPFRIERVPLPVENHIFASTYATIDSGPLPALPFEEIGGELRLYTHENAHALWSRFVPFASEPSSLRMPSHLVLTARLASRLQQYAASAATEHLPETLPVTLTSDFGPFGELPLKLSIDVTPTTRVQTQLRLWDDEPVVLAVPYRKENRRYNLLVWLHAFLEMSQGPYFRAETKSAPMPVPAGIRGGVLSGRVLVGREPVEGREARLEIAPQDVTGHDAQSPVSVQVALNDSGQWELANVAPGVYRVRIMALMPKRLPLFRLSQEDAYLRYRYGLARPAWQNQDQRIIVRPGSYLEIPPFRAVDALQAASAPMRTHFPADTTY